MSKKNEVRIPIKVDGKEILLTKKQIDKLNTSLDKTGTSAHSADRRLKGAAQTSSSGTKNFSKMAQGITGGLVPAYATLAANIFAISAAFRFLQSAGDLRILQQGQLEYAQRTGQSLSILTRQLQAATEGQLAFAEAAQAVAIGTAAGLSAKQINELGKVAKNASLMLGRDLTDSFNRLVRGAVKAEPELLDELGIILRLDTAAEKYALTIGKNAKQLNIFEKSQAVVNEVLEQGKEKFGAVETQVNQLTKLAKSFDDLTNSLKGFLVPVAEFSAKALSQNTLALAGAGTLLGTGIVRAITPSPAGIDLGAAGASAQANLQGIYSGKRDLGNLDSKGIKAMKRTINDAYEKNSSTVINFEKMRRTEALKSLRIIEMTTLEEQRSRARGFTKFRYDISLTYSQYRLDHKRTMAFIKTTSVMAGRALQGALRFAGYAGILISVVGLIKQLRHESNATEMAMKEAQKEFGSLFSKNAKELKKTIEGLKTYDSLLSNAVRNAKALSNIDYSAAMKGFEGGLSGTGYIDTLFEKNREVKGIEKKMYDLLYGAGLGGAFEATLGKGIEQKAGLSADQIRGFEGLKTMLEQEETLLLKGSDAHIQHTKGIEALTELLNNPTSQSAFDSAKLFVTDIAKNGTEAQKSMKGIAQTTQILTSAVNDFSKALNSFKSAQTPLTRLTTNVASVGSTISGIGEAFSKGDAQLDFKIGGSLFDKGSLNAFKTMLRPDEEAQFLAEYDATNKKLQELAVQRATYLVDGKKEFPSGEMVTRNRTKEEYEAYKASPDFVPQLIDLDSLYTAGYNYGTIEVEGTATGKDLAEKLHKEMTETGSSAYEFLGDILETEARRLHGIEMGMIEDKTLAQKNLTLLSVGATKNQTKQLKMQAAIINNDLNISNTQTLIQELEDKDLEKNAAQIAMENEKLELLRAQGLQLQANIDHQFQLAQAAKDSFESGLQGTFDNLMTGKNSSLTEGLANIAKGTLESVSKKLSEQMATGVSNFLFGNKELEGYKKGAEILKQGIIDGARAAVGTGTGDISSSSVEMGGLEKAFNMGKKAFAFLNPFSAAKGGISPEYAKGGITPVYAATGGVFSGSKQGYPAIMHGNEAVVPLPDGKSIPVSGGMGGTVNVSVNMATGETSSTSNAEDMYQMGTAIAQAVENELEKQQRPGGMLAPY